MVLRNFLLLFLILFPFLSQSNPYLGNDDFSRKKWKDDEIILHYESKTDWVKVMEIINKLETEVVYKSIFANFVTVKFDRSNNLWRMIEKFESFSEIIFAEPNGIASVCWTPNDPYFQYQWNFWEEYLNMPLAWDIEQGGDSAVIVSILDTGIAFENFLIPSYEIDTVISNDGFYHISPDLVETHFVDGYDFVNSDSHPNDMHGHGTHVCGTVAQSTDNAKGVAGMAFLVSIMPIRVLSAIGYGGCDLIADGIYFAYQNGADILNLSFGGSPGDSTGFTTVHQAIIAAVNAGAIVVAATGNEGVGELSYPAGFEECIAVGATDIDSNLAPYSQWGEGIDVVAPGGDLYDTIPGTNYTAGILQSTYWFLNDGFFQLATVDSFSYHFLQGTSQATPHVSALAALLISHGINPVEVEQTIYSTCIDFGSPGYDLYYGHGFIHPPSALIAGVEDKKRGGRDIRFYLLQNPVGGNYAELEIHVMSCENIQISLYNVMGQKVKSLHLNNLSLGKNIVKLDMKELNDGVYFIKTYGFKPVKVVKIE